MSAYGIPDQTGRTMIVTGGSSGIGKVVATALAARGARVVIGVRDVERGRAAAAAMPGHVDVRRLDLGSLASIRAFADGIDMPVDVLINNAGAMSPGLEHTTDGFERQFGVNHLGPFALSTLLLDRITDRVVSTGSSAHRKADLDLDDLAWERRTYAPFAAYGQSKLAVLLFTAELQRRLEAAGSTVIATAADPGWVRTGFAVSTGSGLGDAMFRLGTRLMARGPERGALPTVHAALGEVTGGSYIGPRLMGLYGTPGPIARSSRALDADLARSLWETSARLTAA